MLYRKPCGRVVHQLGYAAFTCTASSAQSRHARQRLTQATFPTVYQLVLGHSLETLTSRVVLEPVPEPMRVVRRLLSMGGDRRLRLATVGLIGVDQIPRSASDDLQ